MRTWKNKIAYEIGLAFSLGVSLFLVSCGSRPATSTTFNTDNGQILTGPTYTPTSDPSPTPTVTSVPTQELLPPITSNFTVSGASGTSPSYKISVDTDDLLRVKVTAGPAGKVTGDKYGFYAVYDCVQYTVTVAGQSVTTQTLSVNPSNVCPGAPSSQTIDFSSRLTSGHGSIEIKVTATGYDFYCKDCWAKTPAAYAYGSCSYYCPLRGLYSTHTATGQLSIQVNGTSI